MAQMDLRVLILSLIVPTLPATSAEAWGQSALEPEQVERPSYPKTLMGTVGGGLVGATLVGGTFGLVGLATQDGSEFLSPAALGLVYGGVIGYWLGQAVGGSWGSATDAHRLSRSQLLWPAALWTTAGFVTFALVGDGFDSEDGEEVDQTSWYVGAAVGAVVQILGMSITTHRKAATSSRTTPSSPMSLRFYPSRDERLVAAVSVRLNHPF